LVRAVAAQAQRISDNRAHLDRPVLDRHGNVLVPPLKNFFGKEALRADGIESLLGTLLVQLCNTDFRSKAILEMDGHWSKVDPYLSLRRTAIKAGFVADEYSRDPGDRIERAVAWERQIGLISHTQHQREVKEIDVEQADGTIVKQLVTRSKASMRRLSFTVLMDLGPPVAAACVAADRKARRKQRKGDAKFKETIAAGLATWSAPPPEELPAVDPLAPAPRAPGAPDPLICDAVAEDHPDWLPPQIFDEARRREALLPVDSS
jgi:hypothetical protein